MTGAGLIAALRGIASCATRCECCEMHKRIALQALDEHAKAEAARRPITDAMRLDFIEAHLCRDAHIQTADGHLSPVRSWTVVTARGGDSLRDTIDTMMRQIGRFTDA